MFLRYQHLPALEKGYTLGMISDTSCHTLERGASLLKKHLLQAWTQAKTSARHVREEEEDYAHVQ